MDTLNHSEQNPHTNEEKIYQKTVVAQVMERIKELISSGYYKVGDRLPTEQELAERFGIGRSSIREAIKIFQYLGVLESRVPKGTFLCGRSQIAVEAISWSILLGDKEMWEILELREVIEERCFMHLMTRFIRDPKSVELTLQALRKEVENMMSAAKKSSLADMILADYNFHAIIIREGGNKVFWAIYQTLYSFMKEEIRRTYEAMTDLMDVYYDHKDILDTIMNRDLQKAVARHNAHFLRIKGLLSPGMQPKI